MLQIKVKRLHKDAVLPVQGSPVSAGFDLTAVETVTIEPNTSAKIPIGLAIALPDNYWCKIAPRSSHGFSKGVIELAGVIDEDYRGVVGIKFMNLSDKTYTVEKGERFAQMIPIQRPTMEIVEVEELPTTDRGEGGFGSTGK